MRIGQVLAGVVLLGITAADAGAQAREARPRQTGTFAGRQNRGGPEETERNTWQLKLPEDGRFSLVNVAGNILVNGASGDAVVLEAIKRTNGSRDELARVRVDIFERPGRLDVRTRHLGPDRTAVDYNVSLPAGASVSLRSVSGDMKVVNVRGIVRAESVSGAVLTSNVPRVEWAKSISGSVEITNTSTDDAELNVASTTGTVRTFGLKARRLRLNTVTGDLLLGDITCETLDARSVTGKVEYAGALSKSGHYEISSHSGPIRLVLSPAIGFDINTESFAGTFHSELPLTVIDQTVRRGVTRSMRGTFGDGSAILNISTFSGDVVIVKR